MPKKRTLFLQLLFVILTFLMMVVSSSLFVRNILKNHLSREAEDMLTQTRLKISSELIEAQTMLSVVTNSVHTMILQGESSEALYRYLRNIHKEIENTRTSFIFEGFIAYFEAFGNELFHSGDSKDENFNPKEHQWFETSNETDNKIDVTPIYFSQQTNQYNITYVQRLFGNKGESLGMVCLNVPLNNIREYVKSMHISKGGYGVLFDTKIDVIEHPSSEFIGRKANQISSGFSMISDELELGNNLFESEFENYLGQRIVAYTMRIDNGWALSLITPKDAYYKEMQNMMLIISILGSGFALVLIVILIRIDSAKGKSDEQNLHNELLLADLEKQHEADKRTQIMLDATPLGCKLWDRNLNVIECNQEALHLFDLKTKEEFFTRFFELSPEYQPDGRKTKEKAEEFVKKAFDEGYCRFEWMHKKLNGEAIPAEITLVRVKHKEDFAVAGYIRDLREYKKAMTKLESALLEAQEANTAKSKFLATMSHEIRTPMNVILGVTESQLLNNTLSQEAKESFEKILDSGSLLLSIINDILDLSKIEAGKFELNPAHYELLSLINDAANMSAMRFGYKQIDFLLHLDENIPLHLFGDELRIKQVLFNLLSNAFKYTNAGEVKLSFAAKKIDEKNTTLIICVSDTGQGMTPEQVNQLFEEYTRFNLETNRTTSGTGLGMTITRNLVKKMGGKIDVDSTPGKGTSFTVYIPQGISGQGILGREVIDNFQKINFTNIKRKEHTKIDRSPMPYGKVLIVDDMNSNLDVAKLLLNPYHLQIETAESGFEALDIIKSGKVYDIIFMDHMMPKMDGIETTKNLREYGYNHTILALTADAVAGQREMFMENGFDGFLSKPIDIRQLNDSLNKFIRDKQPPEPSAEADHVPSDPHLSDKTIPKTSAEADQLQAGGPPDIPGIEAKTGLALYNGEFNLYLGALRSFVPNAITVIEKLRNVTKESLPDYAINVHGLKSISANIGAEKLQKAAFYLETKAKSGDLEEILFRNNSLLEETKNIISALQEWLGKFDSQNPKPLLAYPDRLLLSRLYTCCEAYDMDGIDEVMDKLESADYENDASLVIWLREKITELNFSEIVTRLKAYNEELK